MVRRDIHPDILFGRSYPLGATVYPTGVNFSVYSKNAHAVELLLFDDADDAKPSRVFQLHPDRNRTFFYWHKFVPRLQPGQLYGFRVFGPHAPKQGHRFDGHKLLLDPYAKAVVFGDNFDRDAALYAGDNLKHSAKSVVVDTSDYDWENDYLLRYEYCSSVIYELHVGGFTKHPSSGVAPEKRGTYAGLVEKIPYLQSLGDRKSVV